MIKERIKVVNDSGDKEFFTIVPNYILNHSTAVDQALYLQMKRYAGDSGKCFATQETLMKQLGVGRQAFNNSLKYLIEHKWIDLVGTTKGKTRPVRTYKINNIWQENIDYYKKIPAKTAVSFGKDTVQNSSKIPAKTAVEEEQDKEDVSLIRIKESVGFNLKEEIKKMEDSPRRDLNIIAFYLDKRETKLENSAQLNVAIKRHLRAAKQLSNFSNKDLLAATIKAQEKYPEWTLETLVKVLTK